MSVRECVFVYYAHIYVPERVQFTGSECVLHL